MTRGVYIAWHSYVTLHLRDSVLTWCLAIVWKCCVTFFYLVDAFQSCAKSLEFLKKSCGSLLYLVLWYLSNLRDIQTSLFFFLSFRSVFYWCIVLSLILRDNCLTCVTHSWIAYSLYISNISVRFPSSCGFPTSQNTSLELFAKTREIKKS